MNCFCWLVKDIVPVLCMLGVHKTRAERFIHQWRSVPSCHALSLPSCGTSLQDGIKVWGARWLCCLVPISLRTVLGDQAGREAGDVFAPPPDPGGAGRPFPRRTPGSSPSPPL